MGQARRRLGAVAALTVLIVGFLVIPASPAAASPPAVHVESGAECVISDGLGGISGEQTTTASQIVAIKGFGPNLRLAFLRCTFTLDSASAPLLGGRDSGFDCGIDTPYGFVVTYRSNLVVVPSFINGRATATLTCFATNLSLSASIGAASAGVLP